MYLYTYVLFRSYSAMKTFWHLWGYAVSHGRGLQVVNDFGKEVGEKRFVHNFWLVSRHFPGGTEEEQ